ncbi:unannotated protein [freshwater metagenome]|uniref:Unannotated protein n=1 Tax=freshwater metagenome TaxID=449393 RepID=A0A6J7CYN3_9ZZZZ|nr:hypothetical protein [Actinomycetota bacterium]
MTSTRRVLVHPLTRIAFACAAGLLTILVLAATAPAATVDGARISAAA